MQNCHSFSVKNLQCRMAITKCMKYFSKCCEVMLNLLLSTNSVSYCENVLNILSTSVGLNGILNVSIYYW